MSSASALLCIVDGSIHAHAVCDYFQVIISLLLMKRRKFLLVHDRWLRTFWCFAKRRHACLVLVPFGFVLIWKNGWGRPRLISTDSNSLSSWQHQENPPAICERIFTVWLLRAFFSVNRFFGICKKGRIKEAQVVSNLTHYVIHVVCMWFRDTQKHHDSLPLQ